MLLIVLLLEVILFCDESDAAITWTAPPPQHGPLETSGGTTRRTTQQLVNGSSEERLSWNFILSGETLDRVNWDLGATRIGTKTSSGTIVIQQSSNFQEHFGISASEQATLIIYNVTEADDKAVFSCKVETTDLNVWADEIQVMIVALVKFTKVSNDTHIVDEGSNLKLFCEASGLPAPNTTWTRIWQGGSESEVLHRGSSWDFININSTNAGTYRCKANNGVGNPATHTFAVTVLFPPRISLQNKYYVGREKSVSLHCQVKGFPTPTITWTSCNPRENECGKSRLNISKVESDAVYTCTVKNSQGNASASTDLVIGSEIINLTLTITSEKCAEDGKYGESVWTKLQEQVNKLFANRNDYSGSTLLKVSCGTSSLIVDLALEFNTSVSEKWVISTLKNGTTGGKLGELSVDASSIAGIPGIESTATPPTDKTTPTPSEGIGIAVIVGIVVGSIVFVIIVAVLIWCLCCKTKGVQEVCNEETGGKFGMKGIQGDRPSAGQGNNGYENTGSTSAASSMPQSVNDGKKDKKKKKKRDEPEKPVGVVYAQVDMSKKTRKPVEPEIVYDEANRPTGPNRRPGEIQYAVLDQGHSMPRDSSAPPKKPPRQDETQYAAVLV